MKLQDRNLSQRHEGDDVKLLGVYSSRPKAFARSAQASKLDGFSAEPRCFHIDECILDNDEWCNGQFLWQQVDLALLARMAGPLRFYRSRTNAVLQAVF